MHASREKLGMRCTNASCVCLVSGDVLTYARLQDFSFVVLR